MGAVKVSDKDYSPHDSWCDTQNNISERCNCMVSTYIEEIEDLKEQIDVLSVKLQRTVSAAYHALLEMTAWMGIPEKKRHAQIKYLMENVEYCAEHDIRHVDESQRNAALVREVERLQGLLGADQIPKMEKHNEKK